MARHFLDGQQDKAVPIASPRAMTESAFHDMLRGLRPGTSARPLEGARWGVLLEPPGARRLPQDGLRVMLFGSFWIGHAALRAALAYQRRFPDFAQLVGMATDDPITPHARISLEKRAWGLMPPEQRLQVELDLVGRALRAEIPVYTGEVKTPGFRRLLAEWRPDAIITCGFGQVLDRAILDAVSYGAYNCHPTDLAAGHGAGPAPWDDTTARGVHHTKWSVHQMTEVVDAGLVIGQTPPINVGDRRGRLLPDNRAFFYKVVPAVGWMVVRLIDTLAQRKAAALRGPLTELDLDAAAPVVLRHRLDTPIAADWADAGIPEPDEVEFGTLSATATGVRETASAAA